MRSSCCSLNSHGVVVPTSLTFARCFLLGLMLALVVGEGLPRRYYNPSVIPALHDPETGFTKHVLRDGAENTERAKRFSLM